MQRLLHHPAVISRLRPLRPLYNRLTGRGPAPAGPDPAETLRALDGRGVFLFSFGRSGTTVFCDYLNSHPDVLSFGEILNEDAFHAVFYQLGRTRRPSAFRARFYRHLARTVDRNPGRRCLFDMKFESLHLIEGNWRMPGPDFEILAAVRDSGNPAILIERRDPVARHVSLQFAMRRNQFHSYQAGSGGTLAPFDIDIAAMDREIATIRAQHARVREIFAGNPRFLEVAYEDMFDRSAEGARRFAPELGTRLATLIGVENRFDPAPQLEKMVGESARDYIRNIAEIDAYRGRASG